MCFSYSHRHSFSLCLIQYTVYQIRELSYVGGHVASSIYFLFAISLPLCDSLAQRI